MKRRLPKHEVFLLLVEMIEISDMKEPKVRSLSAGYESSYCGKIIVVQVKETNKIERFMRIMGGCRCEKSV